MIATWAKKRNRASLSRNFVFRTREIEVLFHCLMKSVAPGGKSREHIVVVLRLLLWKLTSTMAKFSKYSDSTLHLVRIVAGGICSQKWKKGSFFWGNGTHWDRSLTLSQIESFSKLVDLDQVKTRNFCLFESTSVQLAFQKHW